VKRRYIAFLVFALAACGGGNGTPADTGPVDSGLIMDTSVPDGLGHGRRSHDSSQHDLRDQLGRG